MVQIICASLSHPHYWYEAVGMLEVPYVCTWYVGMVIAYIKGKDQPGKDANPAASGHLNRRTCLFPCPRWLMRIWSRETGSAIPSSVGLHSLHTQASSGAYHSILPAFRGGVHLFMPPSAIGPVPNSSGHETAFRRRSLPRVRRHRASSPQCSSNTTVTGAAFSGFTIDQL